uniref:DNA-directed RNA polymerases I and III subunit RPAC1 n=1 Tax=Schistocephalus solidus TaxID=70667 RepID=A0A0X3PNL7_SCHSO
MTLQTEASIVIKEHGLCSLPSLPTKWNVDVFINEFQTTVLSISPEIIEFDLINLDCTFANAIRRIIVAEVPSFAIERVYLHQNTSVIADEVFCHRLGLVPLNIDGNKLDFCNNDLPNNCEIDDFDPSHHIIFDLDVKIDKLPSVKESDVSVKEGLHIFPLYSKALTWVPLPGQSEVLISEEMASPAPVSGTILLNKLAVGDEIQARCLAVKGVGRDHAKFSPVSAAYYKLLPTVRLKHTVQGDLAKKLQKSFAKGVITIDPVTGVASVANSRLDNGSREYLRLPELADVVEVTLNTRHFLFTVESIAPGHRPPDTLVKTAIDVLLQKCAHYLAIVERPGFASTPVTEIDADPVLTASETDENACTRLYGRAVGLDAIFVSSDLRRATFRFTGEDHTLGAALRYCILQSDAVKLCGYCQPHPLEDAICFEIQSREEPAVAVLRNGLYCLRTCFEHIKRKFKSAVKKAKKAFVKHQSSE